MKKAVPTLLLMILLSALPQNFVIYASEERKVLSRKLTGLRVEIYAPYQCYPGDVITVKAKIQALEDVKNATVTMFLMASKSEGYDPWTLSFKFLEVADLPPGTIRNETQNITMPRDISPGLTYAKTIFQWSVYRSPSWEKQSHEALSRLTYVKNKDYENLQDQYKLVQNELQNIRTLMYLFLATTTALVISMAYLVRKKPKAKRRR
jgi:hypothetical protein